LFAVIDKNYTIMDNIGPPMEMNLLSQEYSQIIQDINNALDEFYEVLPDIKNTKGEDRKENLAIWMNHIKDIKESCQQLIDEIEEKIRELDY